MGENIWFLAKPFTLKSLAEKVKEVLESKQKRHLIMQWTTQTDPQTLIVKSYPLVLVIGVATLLIVGAIFGLLSDQDIKLVDVSIFYIVGLGFISIHKIKTTTFNSQLKHCVFYEKNIFQNKTHTLAYDDINKFEMSYGRGQYARGGTLTLTTHDETRYNIIDSDVGINNEQKTIAAKEKIEQHLNGHLSC